MKITIIGAGSLSFCPVTISDIFLNDNICSQTLSIALMDINEKFLGHSTYYCRRLCDFLKRSVEITSTTSLDKALENADFVITAIEVARNYYWSQDFHIPRKYGFRQIYGENGGPGGIFHALRNFLPMLEIAQAMKRLCPDALLLNYTNPEAKLVEMVFREISINIVGLCHGEQMGVNQLTELLGMPREDLVTEVAGINHFGWFTKIEDCSGNDLYPLLKDKEKEFDWLAGWDELALPRIMLRTYGLWSYPGANHIGEYFAWSDGFIASPAMQYFFDPAFEDPWKDGKIPEFIYSLSANPTGRKLYRKDNEISREAFKLNKKELKESGEYAIPVIEAISFSKPTKIGAINIINTGFAKGLPIDMAVEVPAVVDGNGIHPCQTPQLPAAINAMIALQGTIHELIYMAYKEKSRNKLLQAILLDPTVSSYNNAVALIDEMCEKQSTLLPELHW